ncbi:class I poly(R)-hydroxyalkanoic acid synthase [Burkholderiaceae bacterium FT117]|nr:class I poly(R)-hydroxyalkanoic acid synthase [Zeimonas sediminis]MCM5569120.1 class I poly(R)-hydroxyalkanoic acid synthase [Zeimonas sediminis]
MPQPPHVTPDRLAELQAEYLARLGEMMSGASGQQPADRRFSGDAWQAGMFGWTANLYLLNAEFMRKLAESVDADPKTQERIRFATQQWIDAMSPANYLATNPEAQRKLLETRGESLMHGVRHMLDDLQKGRISHTDETVFEVGRNMATTPGSVVYQNELFQLIQYAPTTAQVARRPLLMVPPCINKYYILDLQPANSVVAWAVAQGHTVFMLSWRNVDAEQGGLTWDDYIEHGVIEAIRRSREIADVDRINVLGFCVGGTLLGTAAAVLAGRGERLIESMTLLTTFLDFSRPGTIGVFIDENFVAFRERTIGGGGIMPGRELATTFNFLRPNDLVWNYVVSKYLKGEDPPAFDLLYWNADSTNLPGPMFCWYLRHTYLQNELRIPGRLRVCGVPVDLGAIEVPTYIYGSREDHIVPWQGAYESTRLLKGQNRFVLGASGHIAGVINPPAPNKRSHWTNDSLPQQAEDWFDGATEHRGSWWPDWGQWLAQFSGGLRPAPTAPGNAKHRPIEPAPGSYVKKKAE